VGCGCGAADNGDRFLVTLADGSQKLVKSEVGAGLAVTLGGGGVWRKVGEVEAQQLIQQGIATD
jgi:hypothetical protein